MYVYCPSTLVCTDKRRNKKFMGDKQKSWKFKHIHHLKVKVGYIFSPAVLGCSNLHWSKVQGINQLLVQSLESSCHFSPKSAQIRGLRLTCEALNQVDPNHPVSPRKHHPSQEWPWDAAQHFQQQPKSALQFAKAKANSHGKCSSRFSEMMQNDANTYWPWNATESKRMQATWVSSMLTSLISSHWSILGIQQM